MIHELATNLHQIVVPLPGNPLRAVNCYAIRGSGRHLVIDTGMDQDECLHVLGADLETLGIPLSETDFFITHFHIDHLGLVSRLQTPGSIVYLNQPEAELLAQMRAGTFWPSVIEFMAHAGFPEDEFRHLLQVHPANRLGLSESFRFTRISDGDTLKVGALTLRCVSTPGHSPGHTCLYEPDGKTLFSGDHLLGSITPSVTLRRDRESPLREYLRSLARVAELDINLVLPGHRDAFGACRARIQELQCHHARRMEEVCGILRADRHTGYEVASRMKWNVAYEAWDRVPISQKWFAVGEALAHLRYLEEDGRVRREVDGQSFIYALAKK